MTRSLGPLVLLCALLATLITSCGGDDSAAGQQTGGSGGAVDGGDADSGGAAGISGSGGTADEAGTAGASGDGGSGGTQEEVGWTDLTEFLAADSRLVYIASDGDDVAAASVHDRGYYLPDDAEIGEDPTLPIGEVVAYGSFAAAREVLRVNRRLDNYPDEEMFPEWMLFRRGDEIDMGESSLTQVEVGGRSASERRVFTAYGDVSMDRPRLVGDGADIRAWGVRGGKNLAITSLANVNGFSLMYGAANILIEDVAFRQTGTNAIQLDGVDGVAIRRSIFSGNYNAEGHVQGIYLAGAEGVLIEQCVFDMNGYKEDPFDPSTWTSGLVAGGDALPAGSGVQPRRTFFDRNLYLSSYTDLTVRGNIISRGGGGGSLQMRVGGLAERNLLMFNESAVAVGHSQATRDYLHDGVIRQNLVLHDDPFLPPGGFGQGLQLSVGSKASGEMVDNIVAHFHRPNNGGAMLGIGGIGAYEDRPAEQAGYVTVSGNIAITAKHRSALSVPSTQHESGIQAGSIGVNVVAVTGSGIAAVSGDTELPATVDFGSQTAGGNLYHSASAEGFRRGEVTADFAAWQASGFDAAGLLFSSIDELAQTAGWLSSADLDDPQGRHGWERDIVSYMQFVDPEFAPDQLVTVDAGVPPNRRRADAPILWEVLSDPGAYPNDGLFWSDRVLSEAEAKLTARRYHAFLVFIERAKANRKGGWNTTYTADAVNNYIREGFGKEPLSP